MKIIDKGEKTKSFGDQRVFTNLPLGIHAFVINPRSLEGKPGRSVLSVEGDLFRETPSPKIKNQNQNRRHKIR